MKYLNKGIENVALSAGADFVDFAKIEDGNLHPKDLNTALSIGIAYKLNIKQLAASELHEYIASTKTKMASVLEATEHYIQEQSCKTWTPQISETIGDLVSVFSHKMAATISGLGWVGKNAIFISSQFGCGSRLATIFTNATAEYGTPITKSQCGLCDKCVEACPCKAIKGNDWYAGASRATLINPWVCKKYRDSFKDKLGFSHPCCLCIKNCPLISASDVSIIDAAGHNLQCEQPQLFRQNLIEWLKRIK